MPPDNSEFNRLGEEELEELCSYLPYFDSSDDDSSNPVTSIESMMLDHQSPKGKSSTLSDSDDTPSINLQKRTGKSPAEKALALGSQSLSPAGAEAGNLFSKEYPTSRQVFDLEKRAHELQDKSDSFQKKCHELTLTLERLTKATKRERSEHEAKRKSLEAANIVITKQLEKEKEKVTELQVKNQSLAADLAAASEEKTMLSKMLQEKTYESWLHRCIVATLYKATPRRERATVKKMIYDVGNCMIEKYRRERAAQQEDQIQDQNTTDEVAEEAAERSRTSS